MSAISLRNATKGWNVGNRRIEVLRDTDLDVYLGESVSIMGVSGSGKSTLLHLLGLLVPLDKGFISFNGQTVVPQEKKSNLAIRQSIGIIFQDAKLIPNLTVLENVCLPLAHRCVWPSQQKKIAIAMLEQVGLADRIKHYPTQLSGGEMARVAFARALSFKPRFLLADEPTGNLDSETAKTISSLLMGAVDHDRTLVMVTHDKALARQADRTLIIKEGKLASQS